jgi:hypothetical protein
MTFLVLKIFLKRSNTIPNISLQSFKILFKIGLQNHRPTKRGIDGPSKKRQKVGTTISHENGHKRSIFHVPLIYLVVLPAQWVKLE